MGKNLMPKFELRQLKQIVRWEFVVVKSVWEVHRNGPRRAFFGGRHSFLLEFAYLLALTWLPAAF